MWWSHQTSNWQLILIARLRRQGNMTDLEVPGRRNRSGTCNQKNHSGISTSSSFLWQIVSSGLHIARCHIPGHSLPVRAVVARQHRSVAVVRLAAQAVQLGGLHEQSPELACNQHLAHRSAKTIQAHELETRSLVSPHSCNSATDDDNSGSGAPERKVQPYLTQLLDLAVQLDAEGSGLCSQLPRCRHRLPLLLHRALLALQPMAPHALRADGRRTVADVSIAPLAEQLQRSSLAPRAMGTIGSTATRC